MKIPKEARILARELYKLSLTEGRPDQEKIRKVTATLLEDKPRYYVSVLKEYLRRIRLLYSSRHAVIESAAPLDAAAAATIENDVKARYGSDLTTEFKVNADLIGGLRVRVGSDVWDGSVRERLSRLALEI